VFVLESDEYIQHGRYGESDVARSEVLIGFSIPVAEVFAL
jgi:hypothetical protein